MTSDLMRACAVSVRHMLGPKASEDEMIWATMVAWLFATGALAESNLTTAIQ